MLRVLEKACGVQLDLELLKDKVQGELEREAIPTALVEVGRVEVEVTDSYRGSSPRKSKPHLVRVVLEVLTGDPVDLCVIC